ncbi:hypothetical protein ACFFSH_35620 [Streptomyces filamentosus]|uniref:Uncharacterized protein n=1 Tax=Streptomyces filamentosus TaxID=67294 RepID=A0A919BA03_STRFL|nr:hypothetical protein [Streptomyces filamentosus]GHF77955.1 hypothetical protein GCM10017667_01630 [Streptomyces filamentosus]
MADLATRYPPPGPEFMDRVSVAAWVERGPIVSVPRVLLTPARPRPTESVEAYRPGLLGIAQGLGLGQATDPYRLRFGLLLVQGIATLDYGHPSTTLNVPYPETWYHLAQASGYAHVTVGLALRELGGGLEAVHDYLATEGRAGRLWSGQAAWQRSIPATWLRAR